MPEEKLPETLTGLSSHFVPITMSSILSVFAFSVNTEAERFCPNALPSRIQLRDFTSAANDRRNLSHLCPHSHRIPPRSQTLPPGFSRASTLEILSILPTTQRFESFIQRRQEPAIVAIHFLSRVIFS